MQKKWAHILVFTLCLLLPMNTINVNAEAFSNDSQNEFVLYSNSDSGVDIYQGEDMANLLINLPSGVTVLLEEELDKDLSKILIPIDEIETLTVENEEVLLKSKLLINDVKVLEGYVLSQFLIPLEQHQKHTDTETINPNNDYQENNKENNEKPEDIEIDSGSDQVDSDEIDVENIISNEKQEEQQIHAENQSTSNKELSTSKIYTTQSVAYGNISRLGHIRSGNVNIYRTIGGNDYFKAGSTYTNAVYYIKRQAKVGRDTYYLLSTRPSATQGIVGWAKSTDLSTHPHVGVDKNAKTFEIKGNGKATTKAWGGSKDTVHSNLSAYKGSILQVNLTEKVGNNTWYRGKINGKGSNVWLHSSYVETSVKSAKVSSTSRLGHIRNRNVQIFRQLGGSSFTAGSTYTNTVYYIKRQAKYNNVTYYLLSARPSATQGVVGWAKASDLSTHPHVGVDKTPKIFGIKGNGKATTKAWGGSKDNVHASLASLRGRSLHVDLTEKVGNNIWYRGKINGQGPTVWVHSSYVDVARVSSISRLGHIRSANVQISKQLGGKSFTAGSTYTNAVYYIKRQATAGNQTYYLLSTSPSATQGVVGWASANDLSTHTHVGVDKRQKLFRINGNGKATTKAWGGSKDNVHANLASQQGKLLHVNLTEKVGNNIWYRGKIDGTGPTVWVHSSYVSNSQEKSTSRLGHIRHANVRIYKNIGGESFLAGSRYTNAVYYIKREQQVGAETYYLLSTSPSATQGIVGWAKASELSTHPHVGVNKQSRILKIKGTGKAYSKAWGGNKDLVHGSMSQHKGKHLHVNLTERVGNNIWYRGKINGQGSNVWLHTSYLEHKRVIFIDVGHGGSDPGAIGNGLREKDITFDISKRIQSLLTRQGYHVIMSRETDIYMDLAERSKKANDANADLLVSVHINAGGGTGIETWWNDKNSHAKDSEQLAKDVQSEIIKSTKMSDRGVKGRGSNRGNFHMTREPKMPSALVEVGFIDTKSDADKLKDKGFLQRAAEGIVNGIKKFFS